MADFKELHSATLTTPDTLIFTSNKFRVIRFFLRLLSLWRPRSAGFFESYIYPLFVNLGLLCTGIIRNSIEASMQDVVLNLRLVYIVHEVGIWLGHLLGNRYFASRDLETNVLKPAKPLKGVSKSVFRNLKMLNVAVILSLAFFSIMLCVLFVVTEFKWNKGAERFSAHFPYIHGLLDHFLYGLVIVSIVYNLGIGLALAWTLAFLFISYSARLKILENIFLKWKHTSVDAISLFIQLYARPVKRSWKQISWWFLAHNIVALSIPLYGYELAQAVSGEAYHSKHLPQFICYLFFVMTLWLAPIAIAEQIKRRERKFQERINNISPWLFVTEGCSLDGNGTNYHSDSGVHTLPAIAANKLPHDTVSRESEDSVSTEAFESDPTFSEYTFVSRGKELRKFLRFLTNRPPGLVSRGYSLQLNLSLISLFAGFVSFITELDNSKNGMMYRHCNCTLS